MAIYKNLYTVTVITTCGDQPITFDDSVIEGSGAAAYAALDNKEDIKAYVIDEDENVPMLLIVPYSAVCIASVSVNRSEGEDPEDETCVTEDAEEPVDPDEPGDDEPGE